MFVEEQGCRSRIGQRPRLLRSPLASGIESVGIGPLVGLHKDDDGRLIHDAVFDALAPMIEPTHDLVKVVDAWAGNSDIWHRVVPGTNEHLAWNGQCFVEP